MTRPPVPSTAPQAHVALSPIAPPIPDLEMDRQHAVPHRLDPPIHTPSRSLSLQERRWGSTISSWGVARVKGHDRAFGAQRVFVVGRDARFGIH